MDTTKRVARCQHCDTEYQLNPDAEGKMAKCRECQQQFQIIFANTDADGDEYRVIEKNVEKPTPVSMTPTFDKVGAAVTSKTRSVAAAVGATPERKPLLWRYFFDEAHSSQLRYPQLDWYRRVFHFVGRASSWLGLIIFVFGIISTVLLFSDRSSVIGLGFGMMIEGFVLVVVSQVVKLFMDIEFNTRTATTPPEPS